jgi:hypothetical protein
MNQGMLAAQSYFKPNLITVVKKRTEGQRPIRTLEDKGLVIIIKLLLFPA